MSGCAAGATFGTGVAMPAAALTGAMGPVPVPGPISLMDVRKLLALSRVIDRSVPFTNESWLKSYALLGWARFRKLAG